MLMAVAFALLLVMLAGLTVVIVAALGGFLWDQHPWVLGSMAVSGLLACAVVLRRSRRWRAGTARMPAIHPGITMHTIPVSGGMGLLFTLGYLTMFLVGLPGVGPVVLVVALAGVLFGATLVLVKARRPHASPDPSLLHLTR